MTFPLTCLFPSLIQSWFTLSILEAQTNGDTPSWWPLFPVPSHSGLSTLQPEWLQIQIYTFPLLSQNVYLFLTNKCPYVHGINTNACPGRTKPACLLSALHLQPSPFSSQLINWSQWKLLVVLPTNHSHSIPLVLVFHLLYVQQPGSPLHTLHTYSSFQTLDTFPYATTAQGGTDLCCYCILHVASLWYPMTHSWAFYICFPVSESKSSKAGMHLIRS